MVGVGSRSIKLLVHSDIRHGHFLVVILQFLLGVLDRSQNYALHFSFALHISFALHLKNLPRQHEMHATSQFKCHALHLHFMK